MSKKHRKNNSVGPPNPRTFQIAAAHFSGPLPPPEALEHYERVHPGAAAIILQMAQDQSAHRRKLESAVVQAQVRSERRGQWMGFVIAIAVIALGGYLVLAGKNATGLALVISALASLLLAFMYGRAKQDKERGAKVDAFNRAAAGAGR